MRGGSGTCYGYQVQSAHDFLFLRGGAGEPLEVVSHGEGETGPGDRLLREWTPTPRRPLHARLYSDGRRYRLWLAGSGSFLVDPELPRIAVPTEDEDALRREVRLWSVPVLLCFLARGDLPLHAAAVEVDGEAVLLAAPHMVGKTTLAAAFFGAGYRLLSEDLTCLRLSPGPAVVPGPALLRVRPDVAHRLDLPYARVVREDEDRVHFSVEEERRGDCRPVPVRAVVFLRPSDNGVTLERAETTQAVRDLWALSFRLPIEEQVAASFAGMADLAGSVPVWNLGHVRRLEDVSATIDRIVSGV